MKPRRWYSSPELKPGPSVPANPFPASIYWSFTTRTRLEQGPIIKSPSAEPAASLAGRGSAARASSPRLRRIDAA